MTPRWMKMLRDAQAARGRLAMIVVALAASIAAVVTMLSTYTVLMREVPRNYVGTNPASAQLEMHDSVPESLLAEVRKQPNIAAAEAAASLLARIQVGPDAWMALKIFVVPSFDGLRINTLDHEAGAWPPADGTMLVERSALPLTRSALGQPVQIELPQGGRRPIVISGTVHDPGVAPAWQEQTVYAYLTPRTLALMGETVPLDLLKVVVREGDDDIKAIEHTVRDLSVWLASQGHAVLEARIPPPKRHPHQSQMGAVMMMLLIFSLLALVLGAVLTATIIGGLLAQQVRQIAIMKAIGAQAGQVTGLYLTLVTALGLVAVAVGLPFGLLAGRGFIAITAELLNLRIDSTALPWWLYATSLLMGIAAPLLAAWVPIRAAARRTVRDAIQDHGVSGSSGPATWLDRVLARIQLRDAALNLALRNTFRRRTRLALTLGLLAGAGAMFITSLNLKSAWEDNVAQSAKDRYYDLELRLQQGAPQERAMAVASAVPGVREVEVWNAVRASLFNATGLEMVRSYPDGGHGGFALVAAPPQTQLVAHSITQGRWLQAQDTDAVVINSMASATGFRGVQLGDWVTLNVAHRPLKLKVVGFTLEHLTSGAVYVTPATYQLATGSAGLSNGLRVVLSDKDRTESIARTLVQALEREQMGVRAVITEKSLAAAQGGHVTILVVALGFIAVLMAVVGLLGLASSLGTGVIERTREFGVMRAVGAASGAIMRSVLGEGLLIATLSSVVAVAFAWVLSAQVGRVLAAISTQQLAMGLSGAGLALWLTIVLAGAVVVSYFPARRASQLTVRQTLAHI